MLTVTQTRIAMRVRTLTRIVTTTTVTMMDDGWTHHGRWIKFEGGWKMEDEKYRIAMDGERCA